MSEPSPAPNAELPIAKGEGVRAMFDRIAPSYDLLNRVLTAGLDERWRARAIRALGPQSGSRYLDLCAGTLDLTAHILRSAPEASVTAADYSERMLALGRESGKVPAGADYRTVQADAHDLPFDAASFDGAVCGFGLRNLADLDTGLAQAHRVMRPGARFIVLEFFRPLRAWERLFHGTVNRLMVPIVGRLLSGDPSAYRYLSASMESFDSLPDFRSRAERAGFSILDARGLFPGVASMVVLERGP